MTEEILGFEVATDATTLAAFITSARQAYQQLEEALAPIARRIADLQENWTPRPASFWGAALREIPAIRSAAADCMNLFDREQSQEVPIPIIMSATSIAYRCDLHSLNADIEEAGILLTASIQSPGNASIEKNIRERQRVLNALQALSRTAHKARDNARAKLDEAPEAQRKLLTPTEPKRKKPSKAKRPSLRIVGESGVQPE